MEWLRRYIMGREPETVLVNLSKARTNPCVTVAMPDGPKAEIPLKEWFRHREEWELLAMPPDAEPEDFLLVGAWGNEFLARCFEEAGDGKRAALWWEAARECVEKYRETRGKVRAKSE